MSHDGGSSCKSYIKHPTEKERLDNLAFTSFPEDYLPYTSSYHRKAPYLVWDDGFRPHRKRRLKRWRESRACRCCTAAALTAAISLIIIGILSIVAVSIYLGVITSLFRSPILSLSGKMSVVEGDEFTESLINTTSYEFLAKAETYQAMLENIYLSSSLEPAFVAAKVYAFRKGNLTVFFRIYLDRRKLLHSDEETLLIARNVVLEHAVKRRPEFSALSLDLKSIEFRENNDEERTPEMDFDFHEESKAKGNVFDGESEHSHFSNHSPDKESEEVDSGDVQKSTSAHTNANTETFSPATKEEKLGSTLYDHLRTVSESVVTTPSHIQNHERTAISESPLRSEENVSISYGHWQPLVPLPNPAVESSSTKRPPLKDHRRISGSGSVHLVEELFIPVVSQTPATHNIPLPAASETPKLQPNVASSIMSSVSLVIMPSSKNRTVMVTNKKNNVIETAEKLPSPQSGDLKLHESLHSDSEKEAQTTNTSVGTRNSHASLRFIEDFDKNMNSDIKKGANKTDHTLNESPKTAIHSTLQHNKALESSRILKETSKLNSQDSKIGESKLLTETLAASLPDQPYGRYDNTDIILTTFPSKESTDNPDFISKEYLLLAANNASADAPASTVDGKQNESVSFNTTFVTTTPVGTADVPTTNQSQFSYVPLLDISTETTVMPNTKIVTSTVLSTTAVEETSLEDYNDNKRDNKHAEPKDKYDDTMETTTGVLFTNFRFYVTETDPDSSGFLDTDFPVRADDPKIAAVLSDNFHKTTEVLSGSFNNETVPASAFAEFPKTNDSSPEYDTKLHDSDLLSSLTENLPQKNDSSDLHHNATKSIETIVYEFEEHYNGSNSASTSDIIHELGTNITMHANINKHFDSNISTEESALNGSNISDLKAGGLPKVVPPFTNTQYIPNDIHSDTDIHKKDDNRLDDEKLFPVTYSDVLDFSEPPPSDKPQPGINKDTLDGFQPPDDENVVIHHITTPPVSLENDSTVVGLGKYPTYFLNKCSDEEMACGSGECIPVDYQCNMRRDCRDNSDEVQCSCTDNLKVIGQTQKICDGIQDCWDLSDEENCPWCNPGQFICPQSKLCIEMNQVCDGSNDCPFGTDERYCVKLGDDEASASNPEYQSTGYLMIRKQGQWGKLCLENIHSLAHPDNLKVKLGELGHAVCSALSYKEISEATETKDEVGTKQSYFEISTQSAKKQSRQYTDIFQPSECQSKSVVHVTCKSLECGMRPMAFSLRRRIVGGQSTNSGSWPWQVALYKEGDFQCGAVLVSDVWLISAGHCFYSSQNSHWTARLGVLRRGTELPSPSEQVRRITHIFIHPDYVDKGFINDIALLRMESPVPFSDFLRPLCLPDETEDVNIWHGHHCSVVGWGKLYEIGHTFPDSLQEVRLPVISTEECRKKILFLTMYHLTDNMFCAGYERGGRDACLGDSGGPLMCQRQDGRWVLLGVTSNGDGCGRPGRPGVYTKVTKYLTWIRQVIDGDLPPERSSPCAGHRCNLGHCVLESKVCDGRWDCSDGSDEVNCFV